MQLGRLAAMGLLACWPTLGQEAGSDDGSGREHSIPLFMAHGNAEGRQGFIRIINHSDEPGVVEIVAIDDRGERYGPVELEMDERQTVHLNSEDLENSNADKGLNEGLGSGEGNWRLLLYGGALDIEPLAYIRTPVDGFLTSMNDVVPDASMRHRVPIFNPGKNANQQSSLRLINPGDVEASVTITGRDDAKENGDAEADEPPGEFRLTIPPGSAQIVESADLEMGNMESDGIGVGTGKWSLDVHSDVPIQVISLMSTPTNHLSNLSAANPGYLGAVGLWQVSFEDEEVGQGYIILLPDSRMYAWLPEPHEVDRIARGTFETAPDGVSGSGELFESGKVGVGPGLTISGGSEDFEFTAEYRSGDWIRGRYNVGETVRSFHGWAFTGLERGGEARDVAGLWSPMLGNDANLGDFEPEIDGALSFSLTAGGFACTADGTMDPVNPAFTVFEADIEIDCTLLRISSANVDLIFAVFDSPDMPGSGSRAIVLAIVHDDREIALGALFDLERR